MGENKNMRVLVIAAHPDDEVIGCGGIIVKHIRDKDRVYLLIMTQIYPPEWDIRELETRKKEVFSAAKVLGINDVFWGGFPTAKLNTLSTITLVSKIREVINKIKPNIIYLPPEKDLNTDHVVVFNAGLIASKYNPFLKRVLSYEIPTIFSFKNIDVNCYLDITKFFTKKLQAVKKYKTELKIYPHPRSIEGLSILAQERGLAIGVKYAEAFKVVREVIR